MVAHAGSAAGGAAEGGAAWFAGDAACRNDAFTIAAALLAADNIAHVVLGRVVDAPGVGALETLPPFALCVDTLDTILGKVRARLAACHR